MTGGLVVIDHADPEWFLRYRRSHARHGRTNGAATYSREIVQHHIPVWERFVPPGTVISTCPPLVGYKVAAPLVAQYLHAFDRDAPLTQVREVADHLQGRAVHVVFITAYRAQHTLLRRAGYESIYVPMAVDTEAVRATAGVPSDQHEGPVVLYYGNVTPPKRQQFAQFEQVFHARGWRVDVISDSRFNGRVVTQAEAWALASQYRYGAGVGRCALELHALGLRVIYSGDAFGGMAVDDADWSAQTSANFNSRVTTFDRDPRVCIDAFDYALVRPEANPITLALDALRDGLIGLRDLGWFE